MKKKSKCRDNVDIGHVRVERVRDPEKTNKAKQNRGMPRQVKIQKQQTKPNKSAECRDNVDVGHVTVEPS